MMALALGLVLCVFAYFQGLTGPLIFDDVHVIQNNKTIQIDSLEPEVLLDAADSFQDRSRQLSMLSFALNHYLFGDSVLGFKAVTLGIHLVVGILLYVFARVVISHLAGRNGRLDSPLFHWLPEICAILWLVSPINLTAVLYVSQRMAVLSGLFVVAGLLIYTHSRIRYREGGRFSYVAAGGLLVCLAAAYASKENGLLLVPYVLAVEFVLFGFGTRTGRVSRTALALAGVFVLAAIVLVVATERVDPSRLLAGYAIREFTLEERLLTQPRVLLFYIGLILFPMVDRFGLWHDDIPFSTSLFSPPDTALSIAILALLFVVAVAVRRRYPLASLGILWFFVGHAMESTMFPLEMVHEHRNYIASFGVLLTAVAFLAHMSSVRLQLRVTLLVLLGVAAAFNLYLRSEQWSGFLQHAVSEYRNHPNSARAAFHMANVNLLLSGRGYPDTKEPAYDLYRRASELSSHSIMPDVGMVLATLQLDGTYDSNWINRAADKIRTTGGLPSDVSAFKGLRRCIDDGECKFAVADLMPLFDAAAESRNYKLVIEAALFHSLATRDGERILALLRRAMEMAPRQPVPRLNYIEALTQFDRMDEAKELLLTLEEDGVRNLRTERDWIEELRAELASPE